MWKIIHCCYPSAGHRLKSNLRLKSRLSLPLTQTLLLTTGIRSIRRTLRLIWRLSTTHLQANPHRKCGEQNKKEGTPANVFRGSLHDLKVFAAQNKTKCSCLEASNNKAQHDFIFNAPLQAFIFVSFTCNLAKMDSRQITNYIENPLKNSWIWICIGELSWNKKSFFLHDKSQPK